MNNPPISIKDKFYFGPKTVIFWYYQAGGVNEKKFNEPSRDLAVFNIYSCEWYEVHNYEIFISWLPKLDNPQSGDKKET